MVGEVNGQTGDKVSTRLDANAWDKLAATWRSDEFKTDWGLGAMNADYAYSLGYTGKGVKVGVMDSGYYDKHVELDGDNIVPVTTKGTYSADGFDYATIRYMEDLEDWNIVETEGFDTDGVTPIKIINITSTETGPYKTVTVRDYFDANGVKTESVVQTKYYDYVPRADGSFKQGESFEVAGSYNEEYNDSHGTHVTGTVAAARDGSGMHGVAFDSTVYVANTNSTDSKIQGPNSDYNYFIAAYTALAEQGSRAINNSWGTRAAVDDFSTLEGLNAAYSRVFGTKTMLNAVAEVALEYDLVQVWAGGNDGWANPDVQSSLAYFRPEVEKNWLVIGAAAQPANGDAATPSNVEVASYSNQAGVAKYWTVYAAGSGVVSTVAAGDGTGETDTSRYDTYGGTSMSSPHGTGALALVMERYSYLGNQEARDVLLTTATHRDAVTGTPDANQDAPNEVWGWGVIDLKTAMNGPGQFLGEFNVTMTAAQSDVWTNSIGEGALIQRKAEDAVEQAAWQVELIAKGWDKNPPTEASSKADQSAYATGVARAKAAAERVYTGSLVKDGKGSLTLLGAYSSYSGGTWLKGGTLVLGAYQAAGLGAIHFGAGAQTLVLDAAAFLGTTFSNVLDGLGIGDVIDLNFLSFSTVITGSLEGNLLTVVSGAVIRSFTLSGLATNFALIFSSDADGSTLISLADAAAAVSGTAGDDSLVGTVGDDVIYAGGGNDTVSAGLGNDEVHGGAGNDTLRGGMGDDRLEGQEGNDVLYGEDGEDRILGGAGNDTLDGGAGDDSLDGGAGDDVLYGDAGDDTLDGGDGLDRLEGGAGSDKVSGGSGEDTLEGGDGGDRLYGGSQDDVLSGGDGEDFLHGGTGEDTLFGDAGNDRLDGLAGDDVLDGGTGNDFLSGGEGDDRLEGGEGDDRLDGGRGADALSGGAGDDTYTIDDAFDTVTETGGAAGGRDSIFASVSYVLTGSVEVLNLVGGASIDATGNAGGNRIVGNGAANVITGLGGQDIVNGGRGADTFVFLSAEANSRDRILDFSAAEGDRVGVDGAFFGLASGEPLDGDRFVSGAGVSQGTLAGMGQFLFDTTADTLSWDADGSGSGTAVALGLFDRTTLTANDFIVV